MKWLTLAGILYLTRCDGAVLKCSPGSEDALCTSEKSDITPRLLEAECLAGTQWESNCHSCRCTDSGVAECVKQNACKLEKNEPPIKCKPNTSFKRDCNTCTCLENGLGICTMMGCLHFETDRRKRSAPAQDNENKCTPGAKWKESCNSCWCTDNGVPVCTKIGCLGNISKREAPEKECEPGTMWKKSCNKCWCSDNGIPLCTKKGCYEFPSPDNEERPLSESDHADSNVLPNSQSAEHHVIVKRGICKSNQEFQIDCNACKCAADGQSYSCTQNECLEGENTNKEVEVFMESDGADHIEKHSVCKPQDTFYITCNTCVCNLFGTDYSCTNKPCPLPVDVEIFHELKVTTTTKAPNTNSTKKVVCVANRMFIMDCNTCWCNEDGTSFFCTRRICTPDENEDHNTEDPEAERKLRVVQQECRPNEVFELDCNMCRCNAEGNSFSCTRRACIDADEKNGTFTRKTRAAQEAQKACQPGTEFRMDCNKCLCNELGQDFSCTRIDCAAQNGNGGGDTFGGARSKRDLSETVSMQCVAGSVFDRECNVCRCTEDGSHAVCTLKRCKKETIEQEVTESTPSFRCTPGDQFKRDCKDCTCAADGKTVFCTLRLCDEPQDIDVGN